MVRRDVILVIALSGLAIVLIAGVGATVVWQASPDGWFSRVSDAPEHLRAGREARARGDFRGALEALSLAIDCDPNLVEAWIERGELRRGVADLEPALADYNRAIELDPTIARAFLGRAQVVRGLGDDEGALADLERGLEISADSDEALHFRAVLRGAKGDIDSALLDYGELLRRHPDAAEWREERGLLLRDSGRYDEAKEDFRRVIESRPQSVDAILNLAWTEWGAGDLATAMLMCRRAISLDRGRGHAHLTLGAITFSGGGFSESVEHFDRARSFPDQQVEYASLFAWAARARSGELDEANRTLGGDLADEEFRWRSWPRDLGRFLLGQVSEESLLAAAEQPGGPMAVEQRCEACFYAAMKRIVAGDAGGARRLLEASVATEVRAFYEYNAAAAELRRLAPDSE